MEIEKLIRLVYENKSLWDSKEKSYHNRDVARSTWKQIAVEMNQSVETLKTKWRGLRDTFRKELQKISHRRSSQTGGGPPKASTWPYLKSMMFLKDQFTHRKLFSIMPDDAELTAEINEMFADEDINDETYLNLRETSSSSELNSNNNNQQSSSNTMHSKPPAVKRQKTSSSSASSNNAIEKLLEMEKEKFNELKRKVDRAEKITENADYHFLMSLLPYLKKVPEERKMFVRNKLQQVFCEEQLLDLRSVSTTPLFIVDSNTSHSIHCSDMSSVQGHQQVQSSTHGANALNLNEFFPTLNSNQPN